MNFYGWFFLHVFAYANFGCFKVNTREVYNFLLDIPFLILWYERTCLLHFKLKLLSFINIIDCIVMILIKKAPDCL
jgi:hypothetical protein